MYSDRPLKRRRWVLWLVIVVLAVTAALLLSRSAENRNLTESSAVAIREAIRRSALQCYAVEGAYPPDLRYLEEHYGLQVNEEDFYVTYDAFASNLPPTVVVTRRERTS